MELCENNDTEWSPVTKPGIVNSGIQAAVHEFAFLLVAQRRKRLDYYRLMEKEEENNKTNT